MKSDAAHTRLPRSLFTLALALFALVVAGAPGHDDEYAQWRERLESPALKDELRRKLETFDRLDQSEQDRLRDLHANLEASPDRQRLEGVMLQYHEWLTTLTANQRAGLLQLPAEEKIAEIRRLMQQQRQQEFQKLVETKLAPEDVKAIFGWLDYYVASHEQELLATLPESMRERLSQPNIPDIMRRRGLLMAMGSRTPGTQLPAPTEDDLAKLTDSLSEQARAAVDGVPSGEQKLELVRQWVRAAFASRFMPPVSEERLTRYYREHQDDFDPEKREELESLPPEQFFATMRRMYAQEHRGRWGRRGDGDHYGRGPWDRDRDRRDDRPRGDGDDHGPRRPNRPPPGGQRPD